MKTQTPSKTHKVRTFFAAIFGIIAVYLILASITVIWLNRTLTDNTTYVNTVAPLISQPAVQTFVAEKATDQLLTSLPTQNLEALVPASQLTGNQTPEQIQALAKPAVAATILKLVQSPQFATLWKTTNQTAQASLVSQLDTNPRQVTLNLSPAISSLVGGLKTTQLAPLAAQIIVMPTSGVLVIQS